MKRLCLALLLAACADPSAERALVVIAIDGMDPALVRAYTAEGRMPRVAHMVEGGSLFELMTSNPPQSPVAWSSFITGHESEVHGIYDFLHRDPHTLAPYLSTSKALGPSFVIDLGEFAVPFGGEIELLRKGEPFWSKMADDGVPVTVVKVPANYPPEEESSARVLSGMGTPDLLGTPGLFQLFTTDEDLYVENPNGGRLHPLYRAGEDRAIARIDGPPDPFSGDGESLHLPLEVIVQPELEAAMIQIGDQGAMLRVGEWSDWIPISFVVGPLMTIRGMVRAYLASVDGEISVYVSPVNIDPMSPAQAISSPHEYAADLARDVGRFYTQGMPDDTKALIAGALDPDQFLEQSSLVFGEQVAVLEHELSRFDDGFLFVYFSEVDLVSHVFWRAIEPDAPESDRRYAHVIPDLYSAMDGVVGRVLDRVGDRATVMVMSDHGFAPWKKKVHLNAWLAERGYLVPAATPTGGPLGHIDWERTRAYAIGLNLLYLNRKGREPHGIVEEQDADWLLARIGQELEELRDPEDGTRVVTRTFRPEPTIYAERAPDLIIGYARGYRASDPSALGEIGTAVLEKNDDRWSGDHCMDPMHVPGVLATNRPIEDREWALTDLGPWIRSFFGTK
jgi:predicted AlkP superfamily phosphohydrolase/phosphomutase